MGFGELGFGELGFGETGFGEVNLTLFLFLLRSSILCAN